MKKNLLFAAILLMVTALVHSSAFKLDVREHTLDNGLKLLMVVQKDAPRVVCHIYYKVGSVNERPGITGIAHFLEHMMFKGTEIMGVKDFAANDELNRRLDKLMVDIYREKYWREDGDQEKIAAWQQEADQLAAAEKDMLIKDDLWESYMRHGGTGLNASTSYEVTGYYVTLPANKVELQMLLEADRMQNAYFREFYSEKNVVMEERRLSENSPGYLFGEQLRAAFYTASPYHWGVIGWMADLARVTKADMREFKERFYVPNNVVAVYVGDLDPKNIIALAEKYFGRIPAGPDHEPIRTPVPRPEAHKRFYGGGPAATSVTMMFWAPPAGHADNPALTVLSEVLSGETGRLTRKLVQEKGMASRVYASASPMWYAGSFTVGGQPSSEKGVSAEDLEKELWNELELLIKEGISAEELQKAKNKQQARFIMGMQNPMFVTMRLGRAELHRGWRSLARDLEDLLKVSAADVQAAAKKYLVRDHATVGLYTRRAPAGRPAGR